MILTIIFHTSKNNTSNIGYPKTTFVMLINHMYLNIDDYLISRRVSKDYMSKTDQAGTRILLNNWCPTMLGGWWGSLPPHLKLGFIKTLILQKKDRGEPGPFYAYFFKILFLRLCASARTYLYFLFIWRNSPLQNPSWKASRFLPGIWDEHCGNPHNMRAPKHQQ